MINWKLRVQNKTTLAAIIAIILTIIYKILNIFHAIPPIDQQEAVDLCNLALDLLALVGIITDPTTSGITDSARAMTYSSPNEDK